MTPDTRLQILHRLEELLPYCTEFRFGQLMAVIGELAADETGFSIWDVEDADFVAAVERFTADMKRREGNAESCVATGPEPISPTPDVGTIHSPR